MNHLPPNAKSARGPCDRSEAKKIIARRGLAGLANDTKWNELLVAMRERKDWRPAFRTQSVGGYVSDWDLNWWCYHIDECIWTEWMDLSCQEEIRIHRLPPCIKIIDYSEEMELLLRRIGFDFERGSRTVRIFGYYPRNRNSFGEWVNSRSWNRQMGS